MTENKGTNRLAPVSVSCTVGRDTPEPNARGDHVRRHYGATVVEPRIPPALAVGSCQEDVKFYEPKG